MSSLKIGRNLERGRHLLPGQKDPRKDASKPNVNTSRPKHLLSLLLHTQCQEHCVGQKGNSIIFH